MATCTSDLYLKVDLTYIDSLHGQRLKGDRKSRAKLTLHIRNISVTEYNQQLWFLFLLYKTLLSANASFIFSLFHRKLSFFVYGRYQFQSKLALAGYSKISSVYFTHAPNSVYKNVHDSFELIKTFYLFEKLWVLEKCIHIAHRSWYI